jgi:hypothetical protein
MDESLQLPLSGRSTMPASPRRPVSPNPAKHAGIVVFSGGSAANNLVDVFEHVRDANDCSLSYVIPISDNGGSTSEIIRVFGGPGMPYQPTRDLQVADVGVQVLEM